MWRHNRKDEDPKKVWPAIITINGVEYRHDCHPTTQARVGKTWTCSCGRLWTREEGNLWSNETEDEA